MPRMRIGGIVGQRRPLLLLENGELTHHGRARRPPGGRAASPWRRRPRPAGRGNARCTRRRATTPLSRHGMSAGLARLAQHDDLLAVGGDQAARLVDDAHVAHAGLAVQKAMQRPVGAVLGDVLHDRLERRAHRPAHVDHDAVEVVVRQVVPEHQLADAAKPVDAQRTLPTHRSCPPRRPRSHDPLRTGPRAPRSLRRACRPAATISSGVGRHDVAVDGSTLRTGTTPPQSGSLVTA